MPIHNYPFTPMGDVARPMLWVRLSAETGRKKTKPLLAKVDTGADACFFPADVAIELGYELRSVEPVMIESSTGQGTAMPHTSIVDVLEMLPDGSPGEIVLCHVARVPVYFVENGTSFLLGAKSFLDQFVLKVDYREQTFSLED